MGLVYVVLMEVSIVLCVVGAVGTVVYAAKEKRQKKKELTRLQTR